MRLGAACLAALLLPLAGCTAPAPAPVATHAFGGAFTAQATQAQMEELGAEVRRLGGELLLMESFPVQYRARGLGAEGCGEARAFALAKAYVATAGACAPETRAADPDRPVSGG